MEHLCGLDAVGRSADSSGILKKMGREDGIKIKPTEINDFVESMNEIDCWRVDACLTNNMDMRLIERAG